MGCVVSSDGRVGAVRALSCGAAECTLGWKSSPPPPPRSFLRDSRDAPGRADALPVPGKLAQSDRHLQDRARRLAEASCECTW